MPLKILNPEGKSNRTINFSNKFLKGDIDSER
jgi:hypothetical protein